ncbi:MULTISPECIES: hypothetical protein [unclassified Coleofasciculus]|uniref:hypothetical protein n=1 Tax=unclassified Coleofasciculus TaxID=2692782 RepID=UPI001882BB24|nr:MULTISPECIES: hypothetical protein [unclassified Coleofasciculus]MBE9129777.1 hypothetical protein [Coleofasciculus sp. LEGE 07081]MBE9150382.1 hypothetical protein [Coleofasciculus sp. LEGE 07092]
MSQPTINACSQINCPFFENKPSSGGCPRYSAPGQCHLTTLFEFETDGNWLFLVEESELNSIKKVNDRFLNKDKASRKQLQQLRTKKPRKLELPNPQSVSPTGTDAQLQPEGLL